jgi:hypothetical protein
MVPEKLFKNAEEITKVKQKVLLFGPVGESGCLMKLESYIGIMGKASNWWFRLC